MRYTTLIVIALFLTACMPAPASSPTVVPATAISSPQGTRLPPTPTATPQKIYLKIMPLGDSITVGEPDRNYGGYRHLLWKLLTDDGYVADFVGSQQNGKEIMSDPDHEGHSGWKIQNIIDGIDSSGWLETYQPDLILLHIGSNDIRHGMEYYAPEKLSELLDDILQRLPQTHIIVAQVVPFAEGFVRGHYAYNDAVPGIVASKGPRVSLVDMRGILSPNDFADYYHPTDEGYDKMARAWERAIMQVNWDAHIELGVQHCCAPTIISLPN